MEKQEHVPTVGGESGTGKDEDGFVFGMDGTVMAGVVGLHRRKKRLRFVSIPFSAARSGVVGDEGVGTRIVSAHQEHVVGGTRRRKVGVAEFSPVRSDRDNASAQNGVAYRFRCGVFFERHASRFKLRFGIGKRVRNRRVVKRAELFFHVSGNRTELSLCVGNRFSLRPP